MEFFSDRLAYRKITMADLPVYLRMAMDENVMMYITGKSLSAHDAKLRLKTMVDTNAEIPGIGFYMAFERNSGDFIGLGKLVVIHDSTAEIGYSLLPQFWGRKYASEIAGFFIDYAHSLLNIKDIVALVNPGNAASKKLLANFGFKWMETGFLNDLPTEIHMLEFNNR